VIKIALIMFLMSLLFFYLESVSSIVEVVEIEAITKDTQIEIMKPQHFG
jgi:hypothetical protein